MPDKTCDHISTTQLARNLSSAIDQVRIQQRPLAITKGKRTVAELIPPPRAGYPIADLGRMLADLPSLGDGATGMSDDLARIRRGASLPENPWGS